VENPAARPPSTFPAAVRHAALVRPDYTALVGDDDILTWDDLDAAVDRAAVRLLALAGGPGERVAVALPDGIDFAVTLLGAMRAGLVAVPVNPGFTRPELDHVLSDSGARVFVAADTVAHPSLASGVLRVPPQLPKPDGPAPEVPAFVSPEAVGVLLYTSGTEGRPKGAMLTHRALMANHEQLARLRPPVVGVNSVVLLTVPLFHAYGLNTGLGSVVYHGACGVLLPEFHAAASLDAVVRHRVTVLIGVPSMYAAWLRVPTVADATATVQTAVCGAAPLDPDLADAFFAATHTPIMVGYGLTETAPVLTATVPGPEHKPGSVGRPIPGVDLVLRDAAGRTVWPAPSADADEVELDLTPETDPGEIVVRGANLFSGYWPDGRGGPVDGWWGTGVIAYADAEGDLILVDRIGELIIVNGFNVYPREVEAALEEHPAVAEAAAIGVPHPDTGQAVRAYVVVTAAVGVDELLAHADERLARFKRPTGIEIVDELPHSAIGKVRKTLLREGT
jgi:long-chain acyl-CoA synthetase